MAEKKIDSTLLDKAIIFATNAHKGTERRGKGFPYIVHPLEAMSIVATMTNDQEVLAAAALHDVVEDTDITLEDIRREFGDRVAQLVGSESDNVDPNYKDDLSWKDIKVLGMKRIRNSSKEEQMVALGDKLSNMRAIHLDWLKNRSGIWKKFRESDPSIHAWRYYQLSNCFDKLEGYEALNEFQFYVRNVFGEYLHDFRIEKNDKTLEIYGKIDAKNALIIKEELEAIEGDAYLDFEHVGGIEYAAVRTFYRLFKSGKRFFIRNANFNTIYVFYSLGVASQLSITAKPNEIELSDYEESGDGYTATSYFHKYGDTMMKLYANFIRPEEVEKEKVIATRVLSLGINTPLCGDLITCQGQYGIQFERIHGKRSIARAISQEPERLEEFVHLYTKAVKKLHKTKCDTTLFDPIGKSFLKELEIARDHFTDEEYEYIKKFIKDHEGLKTCIHGDLHIGNVILSSTNEVLFIDMADFAYGDPYFDICTLYAMAYLISEEQVNRLFHIEKSQMQQVWKLFVKEYFDYQTDEQVEEFNKVIRPYTGIRIIQFANRSKWKDGGIASNLKKLIFDK